MAFLDGDVEQAPEAKRQFQLAIASAKREDNSELDRIGLLRSLGKNTEDEQVLLWVPCMASAPGVSLEKALNYCLLKISEAGASPFVLVFAESLASWVVEGTLQLLKDCFTCLPNSCKHNLSKIYMVHSSASSSGLFSFYTSFYTTTIAGKVVWVNRLVEVLQTLQIPRAAALKLFPYTVQAEEERRVSPSSTLSIFGTSLGFLSSRTGVKVSASLNSVPFILTEFRHHICSPGNVETKDLLYLQAECASLYAFVGDLDYGNPKADWFNLPLVVSCFRLLLEGLEFPLFGQRAFDRMASLSGTSKDQLIRELKTLFMDVNHYEKQSVMALRLVVCGCPQYILFFLKEIASHAKSNQMTPEKIAEVFAPSFFRSPQAADERIPQVAPLCTQALALAISNPNFVHDDYSEENTSSSDSSSSSSSSSEEEEEEEEETEEEKRPANPLAANKAIPKVTVIKAPSVASEKKAPAKKRDCTKRNKKVDEEEESSDSSESEEEEEDEEDEEEEEEEEEDSE
ncbi:hypothetical protein Esti_001122 [Eimeria stiedai]